jgi:DsbC/DsbD-like thiol-disulfide interchange protein
MPHKVPCVLVLLVLTATAIASAQRVDPRPVTWSLSAPPMREATGPGVLGFASLQARIAPGWHLYSLTQPPGGPRATRIEVAAGSAFRLGGSVRRAAPNTIPDANFGIMSEVYDDSVTFRLPLAGQSPRPWGRRRLIVAVTYQACTSRLCLTPRTDSVALVIPAAR